MRQQPQPSGDPRPHLRRVPLGDRCAPKGLRRPLGAAGRSVEKTVSGGEDVMQKTGGEVAASPPNI